MSETVPMSTSSPQYEEIRFPDGTLVCRIDPHRLVLEIRRKGFVYYFDIAMMRFAQEQNHNTTNEIVS